MNTSASDAPHTHGGPLRSLFCVRLPARAPLGRRWGLCRAAAIATSLGLLVSCASPPPQAVPSPVPQLPASAQVYVLPSDGWRPYVLPGKQATRYTMTTKHGRAAVEARAQRSASMWRQAMPVSTTPWDTVRWSWWVDDVLAEADLADVDRTDAPVSLVLAFDGDKSRLTARARMLLDLARAMTGEEPPFATLVYTWSTDAPAGTVIHNPRSDRIRKIVVDSGKTHLRQWREHERNVIEDYRRAFGETPGPLIGVALMTDTDNTRSVTRAWYGAVSLQRAAAGTPAADAAGQPSRRSPASN